MKDRTAKEEKGKKYYSTGRDSIGERLGETNKWGKTLHLHLRVQGRNHNPKRTKTAA